ncbi:conserved hypothetical protein [Vibrio chagasii]|nr:conserved hypothetical protein [Vibrio chagasii]CAH7074032.1 conserved hypothetical protein [Vibrio chagasii]CAH7444141.1 conserved hypothetical protein [Vibrio chagasii]
MDDNQLLAQLSNVDMNIELMLKVAGLSDIATSWIMFIYVSPEQDWTSLDKVLAYLHLELMNQFDIDEELAKRIARIAVEENILNQVFSQRIRSAIVGCNQSTFSRKAAWYQGMVSTVKNLIAAWEKEAVDKIKYYHKDAG